MSDVPVHGGVPSPFAANAVPKERSEGLVFAEANRWRSEHGYRVLDLGRADLGHESLRAFKLTWGAEERMLRYTDLGRESSARAAGARAALSTVIRHAPPLVGRGVGELLYRHAG